MYISHFYRLACLNLSYRHTVLDFEVSCLDLTPISVDDKKNVLAKAEICAVGLWDDISARLLTLPELKEIHNEPLGGGDNWLPPFSLSISLLKSNQKQSQITSTNLKLNYLRFIFILLVFIIQQLPSRRTRNTVNCSSKSIRKRKAEESHSIWVLIPIQESQHSILPRCKINRIILALFRHNPTFDPDGSFWRNTLFARSLGRWVSLLFQHELDYETAGRPQEGNRNH